MASQRSTVKPLTQVRDRSEIAGRTAVPALAVAPGTGAAVAEAIVGVIARPSKPRRRRPGTSAWSVMAFKATANNSAKISRKLPSRLDRVCPMKGWSMKREIFVCGVAFALGFSVTAASAQTLKKVKDRGSLICGVSQGLMGFSNPDDKGNWTGFDVEFCRAIAAAVLNDATKVKFTPLSAKDRFEPLKTGDIDVLSRNTTWTLQRDVSNGSFAGVTYYDGQGFMVRKALKVNSALELNGASVCTQTGTTTELNLADYFRANNMKYEVIAFATADETIKSYEAGRCDVFTTDVSQLYAEKLKLANANDHVILPEIISKEPLGPLVRHGDDQWFNVVKWSLFAMLNAEELGVSSKNVDEALKSNQPEIRRLLGAEGNLGEQLGLTKDWVVRIVKQVGNYGEVFERNVGSGSKLGISRGLNRLWTKGGIQYAPPVR
jgi:general L-amino acid transport system substrate-binding protein